MPPTACASPLASGSIATIAGTGQPGSSGDGGPATEAAISPGCRHRRGPRTATSTSARRALDRSAGSGPTASSLPWPVRRPGRSSSLRWAWRSTATVRSTSRTSGRAGSGGSRTTAAPRRSSGTGTSGTKGNEGPAIEAEVQPAGLAIGPQGRPLLRRPQQLPTCRCRRRHPRVRRKHPSQASVEMAAQPSEASFGDSRHGPRDGRGRERLSRGPGQSAHPQGRSDRHHHHDRRDGQGRARGDGGPALEASLTASPFGLAAGRRWVPVLQRMAAERRAQDRSLGDRHHDRRGRHRRSSATVARPRRPRSWPRRASRSTTASCTSSTPAAAASAWSCRKA